MTTKKINLVPVPVERVELQPCPFCTRTWLQHAETKNGTDAEVHWFYCRDCGASGPTCPTFDEAVKRWNVRPPLGRKNNGSRPD